LELRAVMSLIRLRQRQVREHTTRTARCEARNRLTEAREMLPSNAWASSSELNVTARPEQMCSMGCTVGGERHTPA
jgi:hypothetical protein